MTATTATSTTHERRPLPAMLVGGVIALVIGVIVLNIVNFGIALLWETIPNTWTTTPAWYVVSVMVVAAVLVYVVRKYVGDFGHSPLAGMGIHYLTPKEYVGAILAIVASLWGGIVLGPEVALISTGTVIGGLAAKWFGFTDPAAVKRIVGFGALCAILALFVGPLLTGNSMLDGNPTTVELAELPWAVAVAIIATIATTFARAIGAVFSRVAGERPHFVVLVVSALIIAGAALAMHYLTGEPVLFVATSGEEMITELPQITAVSTVLAILLFKTIAYAASLGSGFRGGPFFPAMFVGAAAGLFISLAIADGPKLQAAIVVGVVAAVVATSQMSWKVALILGAVIGLLIGSWTLIPAALVGAVVARAIPRWGDRLTEKLAGASI